LPAAQDGRKACPHPPPALKTGMTPTRWLIVAFWAVVILIGLKYLFTAVMTPPPPVVPEQHWFAPPLSGGAPAPTTDADVRLTHYVPKIVPGAASFTAEVTIQNFGGKKATSIEVRIQPYVGNYDDKKAPGPDEMPNQPGGDPMANVFQWLTFPDLDPGATESQPVTFPMRSDADPAESFIPKVVFQNAK
jgi:hypothetical protein